MATSSVGVRELQQNAAEVVRRVAAGEAIEITVRGNAVARMTPIRESGLAGLLAAGLARPASVSPRELPAPSTLRGPQGRTLADLLDESRTDER